MCGDDSDGLPSVAAFTDTYLPTVNGVTYTIDAWRSRWRAADAEMHVVYPSSDYAPRDGEHPVTSAPFPLYDGYRAALPRVPVDLDVDVVHAHTGFALGLAARRLARRLDAPLFATYHTPVGEYAEYVTSVAPLQAGVSRGIEAYERWFYDRVDAILVPSEATRDRLRDDLGVSGDVHVVPNGVDTDRFAPCDASAFRRRYDLPDGSLIGYTGRHGHEKCLDRIFDALPHLDREVTVVLGGDGPARPALERRAAACDAEVRFLGFLDREELPAFYSALDAFVFPSPVETEGLVAREAMACGTPVVGADSGALRTTIAEGVTGHRAPSDAPARFADAIETTLDRRAELATACLTARDEMDIAHTVERVADLYRLHV